MGGMGMLLTYEDGATELGISSRKLRDVIRERGLEGQLVRFGRAVRLPRALIEKLAGAEGSAAGGAGAEQSVVAAPVRSPGQRDGSVTARRPGRMSSRCAP